MVILTNKDDNKTLKGVLTCNCSICNKQGIHKLTPDETKLYMEYQVKGRQMGSLKDIFPNIPIWILSGSVEPLADGFCICPECMAKK